MKQSLRPRVHAVPVTTISPLATHDFADAFCVVTPANRLNALAMGRLALEPMPHWISALLVLRNHLVAPWHLKAAALPDDPDIVTVGIFPVETSRADQAVLGFDDAHLDFRIVIDVADADDHARAVTATTFVKTHNALGRSYMAAVMPFHKLIMRSLLTRMARRVRREYRLSADAAWRQGA